VPAAAPAPAPRALPATAAAAPTDGPAPKRRRTFAPALPTPPQLPPPPLLGEDDEELALLVEANTARNREPPPLVQRVVGKSREERRRVRFDSAPPSVRIFVPASPEPLPDPEEDADAAASWAAAAHAQVGWDGNTRAVAPRPAGVSRSTYEVTVTTVHRRLPESGPAEGAASEGGAGQFSHLVSSSMVVPSRCTAVPVSCCTVVPDPKRQQEPGGPAAVQSGVQARLSQMYGDEAASHGVGGGGREGEEHHRSFPKEKWVSVEAAADPSASCVEVCSATGLRVDTLACSATGLALSSHGAELASVAWQEAEVNPLTAVPGAVGVEYAPGGASLALGTAPLTPRPLSISAAAAPLALSVINQQARPLFVYAALEQPIGVGGVARLLPLTAWAEALPAAELPVALSSNTAARGANCLLLAPYEGLARCMADDAETQPFGESNTFRYVASTGAPAALAGAAVLRLEFSFQGGEGVAAAEEDGGEEEEAAPEMPFCILRVPLAFER